MVVMKDLAAAEQILTKDDAKNLTAGVDFAKSQVILVSWTTSGPPEGKLTHELKGAGDDRGIVFYVQAPTAKIRGQRALIAPTSLWRPSLGRRRWIRRSGSNAASQVRRSIVVAGFSPQGFQGRSTGN